MNPLDHIIREAIPAAASALREGKLTRVSIIPRPDGGVDLVAHEKPLLVSLDKLSSMIDARGFSPENIKRLHHAGILRRSVARPGNEWIANPELAARELLEY